MSSSADALKHFFTRDLAMRLWGDVYYHEDTRTFKKKPPTGGGQRTFVQFLLEPLYKIYSTVLGEHPKSIERMLMEFDVHLKSSSYNMDVKPLLKEVCSTIFGTATGITLVNGEITQIYFSDALNVRHQFLFISFDKK